MIAFIDDHRAQYGGEPICRVLPIAPSTYHVRVAQRADPALVSARSQRDGMLRAEVRRVHAENFGGCGARKVWRQFAREGAPVARCTVAGLMRQMGRRGVLLGKEIKTTMPDRGAPCPADRVNRQFLAPRPNSIRVSDFTCIVTSQGFVYVAFVIDTFARRQPRHEGPCRRWCRRVERGAFVAPAAAGARPAGGLRPPGGRG